MDTLISRTGMFALLKELDSKLRERATIVICGAAAGVMSHGWTRSTIDIDVLGSNPPMPRFSKAVKRIAREQGVRDDWLNDGPKGFAKYLTEDFKQRLVEVKANLKYLQVFSLGRADLFVMKLAAMRDKDLADILGIKLELAEIEVVSRSIEKISAFDPKTALRMDLFLKEKGWRV